MNEQQLRPGKSSFPAFRSSSRVWTAVFAAHKITPLVLILLGVLAAALPATAGQVVWTGTGDTNWSNGANWSGGTGNNGVPGAGDDVVFGNTGIATSAAGIASFVDSTNGNFLGSISSLSFTNGFGSSFQNVLIGPTLTLNVTGATGPFGSILFFGPNPGSSVASNSFGTISGAGATLNLNNANANLIVDQAGGGSILGTLAMTNLDNLIANIGKIGVGDYLIGGISTVSGAGEGSLYLAKTNVIMTSWVGNYVPSGTTVTNAIQLGVGSPNTLTACSMFLGLTNGIFTDSIGVGGVKGGSAADTLAFAPIFTNSNPTAYFRGIGGNVNSANRITFWGIGDTAISSGSSASTTGVCDFSNGSIDAAVNNMVLARDRNGTAASISGTLTFTAGQMNINSLIVGDQQNTGAGNACLGTFNIKGLGANPTLTVNNTLELGLTTLTGTTAQNTKGVLNIFNGTVNASNITVGAVSLANTIAMTNGTLVVTNAIATNALGLSVLAMTNSTLNLNITDNSTKALAITLTTGGTNNSIMLASVPVFTSYPTQFTLIKYTTLNGAGYNFSLANISANAPGAQLVNDTENGSIDLLLPASPIPVITGQPSPYSGSPGDNITTNFSVAIAGTSVAPLFYQWFYANGGTTNQLTDGSGPSGTSAIAGTTNATMTMMDAQPGDNGNYFVVITNVYGSVTSSPALLTISTGSIQPGVGGPANQSVTAGNNTTISDSVSGSPLPVLQWQFNGSPLTNGPGPSGTSTISGAGGSALTISDAQLGDQGTYSLIASNIAGLATNSTFLTVNVSPSITNQPTSLVVVTSQPASFTVGATGVPAPTYVWRKNSVAINPAANPTATNATFTINSVTSADTATYSVLVQNVANSVISSNATLTVNSAMTVISLVPANGASGVCYDTPLTITFSQAPVLTNLATIKIFNVTNPVTPVDTINLTFGSPQSRTIGGVAENAYPVLISGNTAVIYPHSGVMTSNQTYFVTIDDGALTDNTGAYFAGISSAGVWQFTTKPTGPANPTNVVVAADGSGDFCTVQGACDFVPNGNTNYLRINIKNGLYTEIVRLNSKSDVTFRGQTRHGTIISYANDDNINGGTSARPMFGVLSANDVAIENLTLTNSTPNGGSQAEALFINGDKRFILFNCDLDSFQDTLLVNANGDLAYFQNNHIQGNTDYIWGEGTAFFTNCEIETLTSGNSVNYENITQARTTAGTNGFSFVKCQLTRLNSTITDGGLGRDLGFTDGNVAYINCLIDAHIVGWNTVDARYWEFGNSNITATAPVSYNGTQLNTTDPVLGADVTNAETESLWLYGWVPQLAPNILTQPSSVSVNAGTPATFTIVATGIPNPTYQFMHGSTPVQTGPSPSLTIANPGAADAGTYTVVVTTPAGSVISAPATLSVNLPPVPGLTSVGTLENTPVSVSLAKILGAAISPEGNPFSITAVDATSAEGGAIVTNSTTLTYTPPLDLVGADADTFTYTLTDNLGASSVATVNVTITSTNAPSQNQVGGIVMVGGNAQVTFAGIPGRTYSIQRSDSLTTPDWATIGTATANSLGQIIFTDTNPPGGQAFYRTTFP